MVQKGRREKLWLLKLKKKYPERILCSFNALQNFLIAMQKEMNSECESNSRRPLLTAGSAGKLLTSEKCCKENCEFPAWHSL